MVVTEKYTYNKHKLENKKGSNFSRMRFVIKVRLASLLSNENNCYHKNDQKMQLLKNAQLYTTAAANQGHIFWSIIFFLYSL